MVDFLSKLFDTSDFPARWQCGNWTAELGWLHIASDLGVWSAYAAIPCVLGFFALRRKDIPFRTIFLLFGAFILACGTTHLMEAIIFWWPAYRLAGVIKLFTAVVSWGTVLALVPVTPKALSMSGPEELEREIAARKEAEWALERANAELQRQLEALRASEERYRFLVEDTRDRLAFLAEASAVLSSSLDYAATLDTVARLAISRLADWCAIELVVGEGPSLQRVAVVHKDPSTPQEKQHEGTTARGHVCSRRCLLFDSRLLVVRLDLPPEHAGHDRRGKPLPGRSPVRRARRSPGPVRRSISRLAQRCSWLERSWSRARSWPSIIYATPQARA